MVLKGELEKQSDIRSASSNQQIRILEKLGDGGQGEVYRVQYGSSNYALKWFFEHTATTEQRKCIEKLIRQGRPSASFLWPFELAVSRERKSFGYLMDLRPSRFESFESIVTGKVDPTFSVLITIGLNLVECFHSLHAKGLCYRDISFGNGFFDANTGEVLICDNDNVTENNSGVDTVLGTPDFMAPEVVMRRASPSRETDYFSLSVLLFYLLHIQHPLQGKKILSIRSWDLPAREKMFGLEPVFIFDPNDKTNEAIDNRQIDALGEAGRNAIPYWNKIYPGPLKQAFTKVFTEGIKNPTQRLTGTIWKNVLMEAQDSIFTCSFCGAENFFDRGQGARPCWKPSCSRLVQPSFSLVAGSRTISLSKPKRLAAYQVAGSAYDPSSPIIAEVSEHPARPGVFGLRNLTSTSWSATVEGTTNLEVEPGKSIPLHDQTEVRIGSHIVRIARV